MQGICQERARRECAHQVGLADGDVLGRGVGVQLLVPLLQEAALDALRSQEMSEPVRSMAGELSSTLHIAQCSFCSRLLLSAGCCSRA